MKNSLNRAMVTLSVAALIGFAAGCSDDDDNGVGPVVTPAISDLSYGETSGYADVSTSKLRVVHASPNAPAVDVYVTGVSAGVYNVEIRAAGADPGSTPVFETGNINIPDGVTITAVAAGLLGTAPGAADAFRVIPLVENFNTPGAGNTIVRILHAGSDAPTVAVDVGNDGNPEVVDFARFEDTGEAGVELPAGTALQIAIWAGNPLERVTVFTTPALPAATELFVIATGLLSKLPRESDGFGLLAVGPDGSIGLIRQNPVVFALHGSPDAPAVDIFAGSAELADNLSFGELSSGIQVPPGAYTLDFRVHDNGPIAASVTTPGLSAGERYLAVATGFVGDASFTLLPVGDAFSLSGASPLVRVVHASPDAPAVDVGIVNGGFTPIGDFVNLGYGDSSAPAGTVAPLGNATLGVAATGDDTPVATFDVTTAAGLRAFAVASGSLLGTGEPFRLLVVNTAVFPWEVAEILPNP